MIFPLISIVYLIPFIQFLYEINFHHRYSSSSPKPILFDILLLLFFKAILILKQIKHIRQKKTQHNNNTNNKKKDFPYVIVSINSLQLLLAVKFLNLFFLCFFTLCETELRRYTFFLMLLNSIINWRWLVFIFIV